MKICAPAGAAIFVAAVAGSAPAGFITAVNEAAPIHHWRLGDDLRSSTAIDSAGGAHGRYAGSHNSAPGVLGGPNTAAAMPDYAAVPHHDSMNLANGTVMFFFKDIGRVDDAGLISKDSSGYDSGGHMTIRANDGGEVQVRLQSGRRSYWLESDEVIEGDTWHSVAFTFGGDGMRLYVDGVLEDTHWYTGGLQGNDEPMVLGANSWRSRNHSVGPTSERFSGLMDEVMMFDRQLGTDEIGLIHTQAMVPVPGSVALASVAMGCLAIRRRKNA